MQYVLIPGAVHLRQPEIQYKRQYGCQFLVTCRQAYEEGHAMFYSLNIFFLVPGSLKHTTQYLEILRPENKALINTLSIQFTLDDADATTLTRIEDCFEERCSNFTDPVLDNERRLEHWTSATQLMITNVLDYRLAWLKNRPIPPTDVVLQSYCCTVTFKSEEW